jgi:hypothetical protein
MDELPPVLESPPTAPPPPAMCLAARLLNVFAIPGEVFEVVKASRVSVGNWLVPALLSAVVGVFVAVGIASQPMVQQQINERVEQQAKTLQKQVKDGKVEQADADRALGTIRAMAKPVSVKFLRGSLAGLVGLARVFWWALILWLLGRAFLKVPVGYVKALEVSGLGMMIIVLGAVVTLLLMVNLPKTFAASGSGLVVSDFDTTRKTFLLLGTDSVFSLWGVGVLSVGLARLASVPFLRAAWFVFAAWVIQQSFLMLLGVVRGQFVL